MEKILKLMTVRPLALAVAGLLQSCLSAAKATLAAGVPRLSPQKQWAKEHHEDTENLLFSSCTPDFNQAGEEFPVGKAACSRGVRAKDMTERPYFS